jgi:hypothetical protein
MIHIIKNNNAARAACQQALVIGGGRFSRFCEMRNPGWIYSGLSYKSTLSQRVGPAEASALPDSFGCPIL